MFVLLLSPLIKSQQIIDCFIIDLQVETVESIFLKKKREKKKSEQYI
tara:strand:- start:76 stop:216 length:141 start_codon:yes stop_codon:yes gene_type:complete